VTKSKTGCCGPRDLSKTRVKKKNALRSRKVQGEKKNSRESAKTNIARRLSRGENQTLMQKEKKTKGQKYVRPENYRGRQIGEGGGPGKKDCPST